MENWKLLLPQGELEIKTSRQGSSTALLLAGGRKPASEWLVQIAASKDIYCADKGIECCCENNLKPAHHVEFYNSAKKKHYCTDDQICRPKYRWQQYLQLPA